LAEGLSSYFIKRRNRPSASSGEETIYPELKKLKDAEMVSDSIDDDVEETNDVVMEALEKIGAISEQLNLILASFNKLDIIENPVRNIESNLSNLKARTIKLEQFEKTAQRVIKDLKNKKKHLKTFLAILKSQFTNPDSI